MGNNKNKTKSHLSRGKYKEVNPPLWWSNSDAQSIEFVIMSLRFCTKIITLIVLHFCGTIGSRGEVVVNYLIFVGILYSKQIKLPTLLAIEPSSRP